MTEIIKNSKSISLDFIDTGAPVGIPSEGKPVFESVYSNLDLNSEETYKKEPGIEEVGFEKNVSDILGNLSNLDTKIEPSTILEIKELIISFIRDLNLSDASEETKGSKDDFAKLMDLLQKLEGLLGSQKLKVNIQDDDKKRFLDQIRQYLNKKIVSKERATSEQMNSQLNQSKKISSTLSNKKATSNLDESSNPKATDKNHVQKTKEFIEHSVQKEVKNSGKSSKDILSSYAEKSKLKGKEGSEYRPNHFTEDNSKDLDLNKKNTITKFEISKDLITKTTPSFKESFNSESTVKVHDASLPKADQNNNSSNQNNNQSNLNFRSEHNNKVLETLNMLSKTWGNKLIEKIEKSIINGDESLEISISPKSLGKLNITINIQDSLTRINIITENASAAALLGESESKLSQMMEASGLKLSTFLTSSQQFGNNNGKNLKHRSILKPNREKEEKVDNSNILSPNQKHISTKEGLNLIA